MKLSVARVETFVWVMIYGGMFGCGLGIALLRGAHGYGWAFAAMGAAMVTVGALLVWVRSRMTDARPD